MQKIELRNNLHEVMKDLKSKEIVNLLDANTIDKNTLLMFLIESKAGYDKAGTDKFKKQVFDEFQTSSIYSTQNFTGLIAFVSKLPDGNPQQVANNRPLVLSNNGMNSFYALHKSLLSTYDLIRKLLFDKSDIFENDELNIQSNQNRGNLILQVIDDSKVGLKQFSEIIDAIYNLLDTIYLLYDKVEGVQFEEYPKVEMIDSGSDINIVLKVPEKAANLIAQIIKQFWDIIANNKSYRFRQRIGDVEKLISVFEKIEEASNNKVISPELAEVLKKGIYENAEKIITKNTLTKEIVMESKEFSNRQLLIEKTQTYLIEDAKPTPQIGE